MGSSSLAARRSPLTPRPARAPHEQQPTNLRSRRRPSRLLPPPPPHATMVEMVRTSSPPRRATRCRHPENSLTSPYRASRLLSVPRRSTATLRRPPGRRRGRGGRKEGRKEGEEEGEEGKEREKRRRCVWAVRRSPLAVRRELLPATHHQMPAPRKHPPLRYGALHPTRSQLHPRPSLPGRLYPPPPPPPPPPVPLNRSAAVEGVAFQYDRTDALIMPICCCQLNIVIDATINRLPSFL